MTEPIYLRLANRIVQRIEAGELRPGAQLPSEAKLAELESVSLGTVQRSLNHLAESGVLVRRHGRGTFVASAETPAQDLKHFRFLDQDGETILPVTSTLLAIERVGPAGPWAAFLGAAPFFVLLRRLLDVNGEFKVYSELTLAGPRFEALLALDPKAFDGVLIRDYLTQHFNCPTLSVEQRMSVGPLPPRVCPLIEVPRETSGLHWELMARSYRDQPAIYQRVYLPPSDRPLQII